MIYLKNLGVLSSIKKVFLLLMFVTLWQNESNAQCKARLEYWGYNGSYTFKDSSIAKNGYKTKIYFGDGDSAKLLQFVYNSGGYGPEYIGHQYPYLHKDTTYIACVHIKDTISGCTSDTCVSIFVAATPCHAKFNVLHRYGKKIQFDNVSNTGGNYSLNWYFGDGDSLINASDWSPTHNYAKNGGYVVKIQVIDKVTKCNATFQDTISVADSIIDCKALFYYYNDNNMHTVFTNYSGSANAYNSIWDFGDGSALDKTKNPIHQFSKSLSGKDTTYHVCLIIKDVSGYCSNTYCSDVIIPGDSQCNGDFAYVVNKDPGSEDFIVNYKISSKHSLSNSNFYWDFGDGSSSSAADLNPSHRYKNVHNYSYDTVLHVCLMIKDNKGKCQFSVCKAISIHFWTCHALFYNNADSNKVSFANDSYDAGHQTKDFVFKWYFGDGDSSTSENPVHAYKDMKKSYKVCLIVKDTVHPCIISYCKTIGLLFSIKGKIYFNPYHKDSATDYYKGHVWLIKFNASDSSLHAIRDTTLKVDSTGATYSFDSLPSGKYLVKEALDSGCKGYSKYIPTYNFWSSIWDTAHTINVYGPDNNNGNIYALKGTNPGGPGFIGGKISAGANKVGDPLKNIEVMLLSTTGSAMQYMYTDAKGAYKFSNLAYGTYQIWPEVLGVKTTPVWVTIGPDIPSVNNIDISVSTTQVRGTSAVVQSKVPDQNISVYPNPVDAELQIEINTTQGGRANIMVYDIQGRLVMQNMMEISPGMQVKGLSTAALHAGMYLLRIQTDADGQVQQFPFVKR